MSRRLILQWSDAPGILDIAGRSQSLYNLHFRELRISHYWPRYRFNILLDLTRDNRFEKQNSNETVHISRNYGFDENGIAGIFAIVEYNDAMVTADRSGK